MQSPALIWDIPTL